ncbi:Acyl-CoA dehydrogenase [Micromonospora viridifaciens]|uniref:Acyl-CoA dehydrogenase n=1 Tax=Micromonospora viridifaciens TaxID=1881 RepID=A0A1C4YVR8_MICVI|nr:acyl-CoA dehydrogenase family protein [Micromonospora viridifaciens]SCF24746.1 Acyl-CoA dehydrogenase [Micromonospora viridifaciens]
MSAPMSLRGHRLADTASLRAEVREFVATELAERRWSARCDAWLLGWDPGFSQRLAARGWVGMAIPQEYGGRAAGALARFVVTEELLAAGAPVAAHWIADRQSAPQLLRFGTEQQRRLFLPEIAAGRMYTALGLSEPDSGSDLASVRTAATRVPGGWRVTGRKVWTSGAAHAHLLTALVRTTPLEPGAPRQAGLTQFIIDFDSPGVQVHPIRLINGEAHFAEVVLDDVFVADDRVLGTVGDGWRQVTAELAYERSGPERVLTTAPLLLAFLRDAARTGIAEPAALGRCLARLSTLRRITASVAVELAAGRTPELAAALAKDLGTRFEGEVAEVVRQCRTDPGGDEVNRLLREAILQSPGFTLRGGTTEILRGVIAKGMGLR